MEETSNKQNKFLTFINKYPLIIFGIISLITGIISLFLFFPGLSPFYPLYSANNMSQDINYYLFVGNELNNGKLPYIDIADQKGVFTFLLYQFGMRFGGIHMVRFIHIVLIGLLLFFILMTIWELTKKYKFILLGTALFLLLFLITGFGSLVGYQVAFIAALSIYFYVRAIKRESKIDFLIGSFIGGLEIGFAFGTRATDGFIILPIYLFYFIYFLRHKTKLNLLFNALMAIGGFIIPIIAITIISLSGGYFVEMLKINYLEGTTYAFTKFYYAKVAIMIVLALLIPIYILMGIKFIKDKEHSDFGVFLMVMGLGNILLNLLIARFRSYFQSTTPLIILTFIIWFYFYPIKNAKLNLGYLTTIMSATISLIVGSTWIIIYYNSDSYFSEKYNLALKEELERSIPNVHNLEKDELYAIDVNAGILMQINYQSSSKYQAYQGWQADFNHELEKGYLEYLETYKPKYILWGEADKKEYYEMAHIEYVINNYHEITSDKCLYDNIKIFKIN